MAFNIGVIIVIRIITPANCLNMTREENPRYTRGESANSLAVSQAGKIKAKTDWHSDPDKNAVLSSPQKRSITGLPRPTMMIMTQNVIINDISLPDNDGAISGPVDILSESIVK